MQSSYFDGKREGIQLYAWWKDGVQYVGTTGRTLKEALEEVTRQEKDYNEQQMKALDESLKAAAKEPL